MKLTTKNNLREFSAAVGAAALHSSVEAVGEQSYGAACGSLEHLLFQICQLYPQALGVVNDYLSRNAAPATSATPEQENAPPASLSEILHASASLEVLAQLQWPVLPEAEVREIHSSLQSSLQNAPGSSGHTSGGLEAWESAPCGASLQPTDQSPPLLAPTAPPKAETAAAAPQHHSETSAPLGCAETASFAPSSSAHHGDACGDINCDGTCQPTTPTKVAPQAAVIPQLIQMIDRCGSVMDARRKIWEATTEAKNAAALYLGVAPDNLSQAVSRRVRVRLTAAF